MKKISFIIICLSVIYAACGDKNSNTDNCPEQAMPDPAKETNFVACKIDGKVWRDAPLKIWSPPSAVLDYANTTWYPQNPTIIANRRIEKDGCDTIYDHFVLDWRYNKIGENKIHMGSFTQHNTKYKSEGYYRIDLTRPYTLKVTSWDSTKYAIQGTFSFTLRGDKTNDTLSVTEGVFKIGQ
jgi:hypothetical protein